MVFISGFISHHRADRWWGWAAPGWVGALLPAVQVAVHMGPLGSEGRGIRVLTFIFFLI